MNIQWFPGHMAKTRRIITENLKLVDIVVELLDARIPSSSANPIIDELISHKPRVIALNKSDMADKAATALWIAHYKSKGITAVAIDSITGRGLNTLKDVIKSTLAEKTKREMEKGMRERSARMMVVGIPNVGKSSFINRLCGRAGTKTGDRPGVTTAKQWIRVAGGYELLDTPGILWTKFDELAAINLAFTGAIKDDVYDYSEVACLLCSYLAKNNGQQFKEKYKLNDISGMQGHEILFEMGKKRGCLIAGGDVDYDRIARILLDEFRGCKIGNITLERPME